MATRTAVKAAMRKRLQKRNQQTGEEPPVQTGAGGVPRATRTPVPRGGGKLRYSGAAREKYAKPFRESQKLAPNPRIQPGAVPTGQEHKMRGEFRESIRDRRHLNRTLIQRRYGKSSDWHKRVYGAGYKEGTVGRLGEQVRGLRKHTRSQRASIYKLGKKLKTEEGKVKPPAEGEEAAAPSDRAKALTKRISQLEKNLKVSSKKFSGTKEERQKYLDKRTKMLQHLYTASRAKPGSLVRARKSEVERRLRKARGGKDSGASKKNLAPHSGRGYRGGRGMPKGNTAPSGHKKPPPQTRHQKKQPSLQGKTDQNRHPGAYRAEVKPGKTISGRSKKLNLTRAQIRRRRRRHRANR